MSTPSKDSGNKKSQQHKHASSANPANPGDEAGGKEEGSTDKSEKRHKSNQRPLAPFDDDVAGDDNPNTVVLKTTRKSLDGIKGSNRGKLHTQRLASRLSAAWAAGTHAGDNKDTGENKSKESSGSKRSSQVPFGGLVPGDDNINPEDLERERESFGSARNSARNSALLAVRKGRVRSSGASWTALTQAGGKKDKDSNDKK